MTDNKFKAIPSKDGKGVFMFISWDDMHAARVAVSPCGCVSAKASGTNEVRKQIGECLAQAQSGYEL